MLFFICQVKPQLWNIFVYLCNFYGKSQSFLAKSGFTQLQAIHKLGFIAPFGIPIVGAGLLDGPPEIGTISGFPEGEYSEFAQGE